VTYLSELRNSLVDAAHRQHAEQEHGGAQRIHHGRHAARTRSARVRSFSRELRRGSLHGGRAILASVALGLTGTAIGAVQVGPPLGPEPQLSGSLTKVVSSPSPGKPRP
jgi:hypothetical protein